MTPEASTENPERQPAFGAAGLLAALVAISKIGGNLPNERMTDKTGPNDAAQRGLMYCAARSMALEAIAQHEAANDQAHPTAAGKTGGAQKGQSK